MQPNADRIPGFIKYFFIVSNVVMTLFVVVTANFLISPLLAALLAAILLHPIDKKLRQVGLPKILSAFLTVMLFFLGVTLLIMFITAQVAAITNDPVLSGEQFTKALTNAQTELMQWFNMSPHEQSKLTVGSAPGLLKSALAYFPTALAGAVNYLSMLLLFTMSLFFFLYYRVFLLSFVFKLFDENKQNKVQKTLNRIEVAVDNYVVGLFIVILLVSSLNSIGLLLIGVKYGVIFGILGALLTIIPYIGIMIGALLPALYMLISGTSIWEPIAVLVVFGFVQFLEGNIITPYIVGSKENINPFIAILGLFVGGFLLGTVGVILAIPLLGIMKIIFDDIKFLKPLGYVMGNPPRK